MSLQGKGGGGFNVASFVDAAKAALARIQEETIPLRNRLEKLEKQERFLQGVIDGAKELFPDVMARLKTESIAAQYTEKTILRELPPARRMRRHPKAVLAKAIDAAFKDFEGPVHCRALAEKLVNKGLYGSVESALLTAERHMKEHPEEYAKVGPRMYQKRTGAALVQEIIEAKGQESAAQVQ